MKTDRLTSFDLTPAWRVNARSRKARYKRWALWLATYAFCITAVLTTLEAGRHTRQVALGEDCQQAQQQHALVREDLRHLQREHAAVRAALGNARIVCDQADWGALLDVLACGLGPHVCLEDCTLNVFGAAGKPGDPAATHVVTLTGRARQQSDVWAYATRLEGTRLFASVRLLGTVELPFMDGHAVQFRMECGLEAKGGTP
jgi:hypothetical protein